MGGLEGYLIPCLYLVCLKLSFVAGFFGLTCPEIELEEFERCLKFGELFLKLREVLLR